jgi:MFS family permease
MTDQWRSRLASWTAGLPRPYWFLWVGTIVNRLGGFVIPFLALYLTTQRGYTVAAAALMVSLYGAGSFTANLVGGELTDRLGRRPVLLASLFLAPLVTVALGLVRPIAWTAVATILLGFTVDLYRPAVNASIADLVPSENRPRAYGYMYWAINIGAAVAPILAGLLAHRNYLWLFIGDAVTTFGFGLFVLAGVPESRPPQAAHAAGEPLSARLRALGREPLLLVFTIMALVLGTVYLQSHVTLPIDMQAHGLTTAQYGMAIAVNGALIVVLGLPASNASSRWPRFGAIATSALLVGVGFGMNAAASTLPVFALGVAVWTLGEIAFSTVAPSLIADLAPVEYRGLYQGVFGASFGLSFFTGPIVGGLLYDRFGPHVLWTACLVTGMALSAGYLLMGRAAKARPQPRPEVAA